MHTETGTTHSSSVPSPLQQPQFDVSDFTTSLRRQNSRSSTCSHNKVNLSLEADISDSPVLNDYGLRKHHSTSTLAHDLSRWSLGVPSFIDSTNSDNKKDNIDKCITMPSLASSVSSSPSLEKQALNNSHIITNTTKISDYLSSPSPSPPTLGQDITENDTMDVLSLDPNDLAQFRKWMVGFCIVNFDLEIGQALDYVYPPMDLTLVEQKNICFSAFPDSNVFEVGDQVFSVRLRASNSMFAASGPTTTAGFLYGYVFFRQKKDPSIRRGYFQKSLVLLSQHPYVGLFSRIVAILGPSFFDAGQPMLEAAVMNIVNWQSPRNDGHILDLPFLGHLLEVELPQPGKPQILETSNFDMNKMQPDIQVMASVPVGGLYFHFKDIFKDLWLLWELILLGEPIIVIAPDPAVCSEAVASLVDLINPIPYCGDYRPYFTIQDSDFKSFVNKNQPPTNLILGVTNPFFNTAIGHWPHLVRVGRQQPRKPDGTLVAAHSNNKKNHSHKITHSPKPSLGSKHNVLYDFAQGVTSKRKGVIEKDKALLRMLTEATVRGYPPDWLLNNMLRHYFVELTEKFLVPLNRYFNTLIPNERVVLGSDMKPPQLRPFQTDQFMKSLKEHGSPLPFKSTFKTRTSTTDPARELYSQFLKCGNFATWLQQSITVAQQHIDKSYLVQLCLVDPKRSSTGSATKVIREVLNDSTSSSSNLASIMTSHQREQLEVILKTMTAWE
ncbi:hypothetical protein BCR42DRAFT_79445 [Absidia repens]|uniref:UDENN domain-containing protein n=1 Tax=Absidia repens TaxID=90262 RepID=A0A1X2I9B3_9FUNG|nr:hypothetical protein BCR42DRAFT_79445 [Absidia repens]